MWKKHDLRSVPVSRFRSVEENRVVARLGQELVKPRAGEPLALLLEVRDEVLLNRYESLHVLVRDPKFVVRKERCAAFYWCRSRARNEEADRSSEQRSFRSHGPPSAA